MEGGRGGGEGIRGTWIVVLAWNRWQETSACLRSLEPVARRGARVLLVDNGSSDGTAARARDAFPWAEVLETGANLGFTGGGNAGIRRALERGAGFVVLLNNDTEVDEGFADALLEAERARPGAGFYCSKVYFAEPRDAIWFAGATFDRFTGRTRHLAYGERDRGRFEEVREIERPCSCAVLLTRPFLESVGLMDEALFAYCDDVEWMLRARAKGFGALLVPASRVWHKVSASSGGPGHSAALYYGTRNVLYTLDRHEPLRFPPFRWVRTLAVAAVMFASVLTQARSPREGAAAVWRGLVDGTRGRMGPRP